MIIVRDTCTDNEIDGSLVGSFSQNHSFRYFLLMHRSTMIKNAGVIFV